MYESGRTVRLRNLRTHFLPLAVAALVVLTASAVVEFAYDERSGGPFHPAPVIRVSEIGWTTSGQVLSSGPGVRLAADSHTTVTLVMTNALGGTIEFTSATTNATGFSVVATQLPPIPAGSSENLTVTLATPSTAYAGPLWIDLQ